MADKENSPPTPGRSTPTAIGLRPWHVSPFSSPPPLRAKSPNNKASLSTQRDHSACGRSDTPLRVRKTRENLRVPYPNIPPPCLHLHHDDAPVGQTCEDAQADIRREQPEKALPSVSDVAKDDLESAAVPPPRMRRHKSVSRKMLSKVRQGISNRSRASSAIRETESDTSLIRRISGRRKQSSEVERRAQSFEVSRDSIVSTPEESEDALLVAVGAARSFTASTVSTGGILADEPSTPLSAAQWRGPSSVSSMVRTPSSSVPEQTPRPFVKEPATQPPHVVVPYVNLVVTTDHSAVDAKADQDVWVAIEASVCGTVIAIAGGNNQSRASCRQVSDLGSDNGDHTNHTQLGSITSLRLCFKPVQGCLVSDAVGQKTLKDLRIGQKCSLFVKVRVPKLSKNEPNIEDDQASLFDEIESIVGTLQTELLHIEARYRLSILPHKNVITVRDAAKIGRPRTDSRWSVLSAYQDLEASEQTHTKLAIHLADHYPAARALKFIDRYLAAECQQEEPVRQIRQSIANELVCQEQQSVNTSEAAIARVDKPAVVVTSSESLPSTPAEGYRPKDEARNVWQHIRRSSLTAKQLADMTSEQLQGLEADDEAGNELRKRALANKRSVGAETLKGWKWDNTVAKMGEAPWL